MENEKNKKVFGSCLVIYSILQAVFVLSFGIFAGIYAIFMLLFSGMAHGKSQQETAEFTSLLLISVIVILVTFTIFSLPKIFKTGNGLVNNQVITGKTIKSSAILSFIGIVLSSIAFAITVWRFTV
jgi:hypothetical protein